MAQSFDQLLARHCAPALAGIKPANLVSCSKADYPHLPDLLEEQGPKLEERGIQDGDTVSLDGYEFEYQI